MDPGTFYFSNGILSLVANLVIISVFQGKLKPVGQVEPTAHFFAVKELRIVTGKHFNEEV